MTVLKFKIKRRSIDIYRFLDWYRLYF